MSKKKMLFTGLLLIMVMGAWAQRSAFGKMSPWVKMAAMEHTAKNRLPAKRGQGGMDMCAFVKLAEGADSVLARHDCRQLARFGQIAIASIPLHRLSALAAERGVMRIEAGRSCSALMDQTPGHVNALPVYAGTRLPQAFTGKGVVVGVEDIGFDLTHPNFYDATGTRYRISRLWDQLADTLGANSLYVGAEFKGERELLEYAHSRDGLEQTHGTHTAGTAAGSGFDSPYRGMAWESDICLVSNLVTADTAFVEKQYRYKYTTATDALGFKYIFDYAESLGRPCVVSFSEGSHQDFYGDDQLLYETLAQMVGPGRIFVASAGNSGGQANHLLKPVGVETAGCDVYNHSQYDFFYARSADPFKLRFTFTPPEAERVTCEVATDEILQLPDSLFADTLRVGTDDYGVLVGAYPSCYNEKELIYEVILQRLEGTDIGSDNSPVHVDAIGREAKVEFFNILGYFLNSKRELTPDGYLDEAYAIHSPASAPAAICVGATSYRTQIVNYKGEVRTYDHGTGGQRGPYSSIGPTFDERIKPDVMAPGSNIISSYSSWYLENHPDAADIRQDVEHFDWKGRTYAWNSNGGTSMATPVVSGAIALWLQAKPTLTPDEIKEVFARTCTRYTPQLDYPNNIYGYGQIDVYRGLLDILQLSGIDGLSQHQPERATLALHEGNELEISFAESPRKAFSVKVFSTAGGQLTTRRFEPTDSRFTLSLSHLPRGIYAVQIDSNEPAVKGSELIRVE